MQAFDDEATSDRLEAQGKALEEQTRLGEALLHFKRALAARERLLGTSSLKTVQSSIDVARCLSRQSHYAEALPHCNHGLGWVQAHPSLVEPGVISTIQCLQGDIMRGLGRFQESLAAYQAALSSDTQKVRHGTILNNLAGLYKDLGQYNEALDCYWQSYDDDVQKNGEDSLGSLSILNNIALTVGETGQHQDMVLELLQKVYNGYLNKCGEAHRNTIITASSISGTLKQLGRLQDAETWSKNALRNAERTFGEENQPTLTIANTLGIILSDLGKYDEAAEVLEDCISGLTTLYGADHHLTLTTRSNLGIAIRGKGDLEKALTEQELVYTGISKAFGSSHPSSRKILQAVISIKEDMGRYSDAAKDQEILLDAMFQYSAPHGGHVKCIEHMAELFRKSGDVNKGRLADERAAQLQRSLQRSGTV